MGTSESKQENQKLAEEYKKTKDQIHGLKSIDDEDKRLWNEVAKYMKTCKGDKNSQSCKDLDDAEKKRETFDDQHADDVEKLMKLKEHLSYIEEEIREKDKMRKKKKSARKGYYDELDSQNMNSEYNLYQPVHGYKGYELGHADNIYSGNTNQLGYSVDYNHYMMLLPLTIMIVLMICFCCIAINIFVSVGCYLFGKSKNQLSLLHKQVPSYQEV